MSTNPPAGWYPDQTGTSRYWDGQQWTEHTQPAPQAQPTAVAPTKQEIRVAKRDERHAKSNLRLAKLTGPLLPQVKCPHCGGERCVYGKKTKQKSGVSGGKATGAIITGGVSLLATGLSRKQTVFRMRCATCGVEWLA